MGNTSSAEPSDDLSLLDQPPLEEVISTSDNLLDFSPLFVVDSLHKALLTVKEPPGSPLVVYREQLVRWLSDKVDKSETSVNAAEFVDYLVGKGCGQQEATTSFEELDTEGEGMVDVTYCLSVLKSTTLRELLPCPHLPGLVDLYSPEHSDTSNLYKALLQYLVRHRVRSDKLVLPALSQVNITQEQRAKLVAGRCLMMEEREKEMEFFDEGGEDDDEDRTERMVITKCYSTVRVSTNEKRMDSLFDSSMETYWQSNGSPRSHWIRVHLLPGVMVQELAVSVRSSDDSYMPKVMAVSVGSSESSLREIKTINIPRHINGRYVLIRNLASKHSIIQINIKGCHSDGCDCRVRGLHLKGCKQKKEEPEPTVMDTMAIWYLNIVACTAKAAMPIAPTLRDSIIQQSKTSLKSLAPLSLSPSSPLKPDFFSSFVISEMDKFLTSLCLPAENFVSVDADPLHVLLSFALSHGNVNTILDTLQILLDNVSLELALLPLLKKMEEVKKQKQYKHAEPLKLELVACDGGKKDDEHSPDRLLLNLPDENTDSYVSDKGKKVVNVLLKEESSSSINLSSIKVKVQTGSQGARAGLVFLLNSEPKDIAEVAKETEKFDAWTMDDYKKLKSESSETATNEDFYPVAYFEPDKMQSLVELSPDVSKPAKFVVFKFLSSEKEGVERVGVHSVRLYGQKTVTDKADMDTFLNKMESVAPLAANSSGCVPGGVLLVRVLGFLTNMLTDLQKLQLRRKAASLDPTILGEEHLAVEGLSLEKIWHIYIPLTLNPDPQMEYASVLCLHVLKAALPFIKPAKPAPKKEDSPVTSDPGSVPSEVLSHLCGVLDSSDVDPIVRSLAQDIIVEGVVIFFPDAKARKEYLLSMIGSILEDNQPKSWWLKFEALCHYFSNTDSNSILSLPKTVSEDTDLNTEPTLNILTTMLKVATREAQNIIKTGASKPDDLVKLLSALQASLLFWCKKILGSSAGEKAKKAASSLLSKYVSKLVDSCVGLLRDLGSLDEISETLLETLKKSLLGRPLPELLVFLITMVDCDIDSVALTNKLQPLVPTITQVFTKAPDASQKLDSEELESSRATESVVGVWTRESPHNYENNMDKSEEFVCSSATRFVVDFDPRCVTERRYDYLEFTDSQGVKTKFDGDYGSSRWAKRMEFKGQKLGFRFHSDGSNNEWGYKFTLKAYGVSPPTLNWLFDTQLSLSSALGLLSSSSLGKKRTPRPIKSEKTDQEKEEESLVDSELWKTLFRGGYMVGKLTRSLSGAYAASPADSALSALLQDLANGPEGVGLELLELYRAESKGHFYGGPLVDKAVNSVFAALIWHTQEIREELLPFAFGESPLTVTPGVLTAFKSAEAMRRDLVEARQKVVQSKEKEEKKEEEADKDKDKDKEKPDEDAPVKACHDKALFLLKFSGLIRVKEAPTSSGSRPQWAKKSLKWQKVTNAVSTVGVLKHNLSIDKEKPPERYSSFDLILNFVKNELLSVDRVQALLQQRSKVASSVAQTYNLLAEVVRVMGVSNLFELPGLVFLQHLLAKQQLFPRHYAAKLDGCGLELENQVRKSYRLLLIMLVENFNSFKNPPSKEHSFARSLVLLYLTHLIDFEWQDYDHALLSDLELPEFLFSSAVSYSVTGEKEPMEKFENEDEMLSRYEIHMKLLQMFKDLPSNRNWRNMMETDYCTQHMKETHTFLVAYSLTADSISMKCDNCSSGISGRWFRDTEVEDDFDLCPSCFDSDVGREKSAEHKFMSIGRFGCDGCGMAVIGHRFHSETRYDFDLCLGCFRKEQATGKEDSWTVFPFTEVPATEKTGRYFSSDKDEATGYTYKDGFIFKSTPSSQLRGYVHQHCWMLFSSLCMAMAHTINKTSNDHQDYLFQASKIKFDCLKLLTFSLRAAILDKLEKAAKKKEEKKREEERKREEEEKKLEEEKKESSTEAPTDQTEQSATSQPEQTSAGQSEETPADQSEQASADQSEQVSTPEQASVAQSEETSVDQTKDSPVDEPDADLSIPPEEKVKQKLEETTPVTEETTPTEGSKEEEEEESLILIASKKPQEVDSTIGYDEKSFVVSYTESILGLLTAVLPKELTLSAWIQQKPDIEVFLAEELLPSILQLSSCCESGSALRFQTLLIAAQYFARLNPQVADRAVEIAQGLEPQEVQSDTGPAGLKTVEFFFECGASSLKKSDFAGASTAESCLLLLSRPPTWRPALYTTISQCLDTGLEDMDLSSVFGLLVFAGFPKVPRAGCLMTYSGSGDHPSPVVLLKVEDTVKASAVNVKTRERIVPKLSDYEIEDTLSGCIEASKLDTVLPLVKTGLKSIKPDSERCVENAWILGLSLKALHIILQSPKSESVVKTLADTGMVSAIVKLASKPTNFSQKWRLAELEVLGMSMYQPKGAVEEKDSSETKDEGGEASPGDSKDKEDEPEEEVELSQAEKDAKILEGLPEDAQTILQTLSEVFVCRMSVLRAMMDSVEGDMERFMVITEQSYDGGEFKPSDEILEAAKKWEPDTDSGKTGAQDSQQNTEDMGVTRLVPVEVDLRSVEAVSEDQSIFKKTKNLLKSDSKEEDTKNSATIRQESYSLLKEELTSLKNKPPTRDAMFKTFHAIAVLQARRVLARLLTKWPNTETRLSSSSLGCVDMPQYFCLLDLLVKQEGEEILSSVLKCGEPTELISLVVTAVQCMNEVSVGKETRVIKYNQEKGKKMKETGKIVVPNATNVNITFHPVNGTITFSSTVNLSQHAKSHTSSTFDLESQQSHVIPGDTVYYEVEMADPGNKNTVCTFSVNGTQLGRFDTGHSILYQLLCSDTSPAPYLPLSQLWPLLIAVACKYTGSQRLKVVKLLMRLAGGTQTSSGKSEGDVVVVSKDRIELSALKPLWQLYTNLIKTYDEKNKGQQMLTPEILRVFTELFLTVENLAEEWGISQDLMIRTITKEELNKWLEKGISNVAYLSLGLGLENTASSAFIKAKKEYVPPPSTEKKDWEAERGDDTQTEDTDSFDEDDPTEDDSSPSDDSDES